jgi:hypothetical protein
MTTPLPAEITLPTGQTAWLNPYRGTYTTSRGYALRMQRNYDRGLSQSSARGHAPSPQGFTEYQLRTMRFQRIYGFSYSFWRRMERRYIREINRTRTATPGVPGAAITPDVLAQDMGIVRQFYGTGPVPGIIIPPENIVEERLAELLYAMREYRHGNKIPGSQDFQSRDNIRPIEMYWYH